MKANKTRGNLNSQGRPKAPAPPKAGLSKDRNRRFGAGGKLKTK